MLIRSNSFAANKPNVKKTYGIDFLFFFRLLWRDFWTDELCFRICLQPPNCLK